MCTEIQIKDGPRIERCSELWELVGRDKTVYSHAADFGPDDCLCHVDVQATAKNAGYAVRNGWNEAGVDYVWELKSRRVR